MSEIQRSTETVTSAPVENGVTTERVAINTSGPLVKTEMIIYYILSILEALLAIRVVLSLLAANRYNGFAKFIYNTTHPLVAPFLGLFGYKTTYGTSRLEVETLTAMVVYAVIAWAITKLVRIGRA